VRLRVPAAVATAPLVAVLVLSGCSGAGSAPDRHRAARHDRSAAAADRGHPDAHAGTAPRHRHDGGRPARQNADRHRHNHEASVTRRHRPVNPCRANNDAQKAIVSLAKQHMWMCARQRSVFDTPITSGIAGTYTRTPTGNYWIQGRNRNTTLTLNTGATYPVRYWIPFDAPLFGFHDSSWQRFPYGSPKYQTDGSHGCIHMPLRAIAWFYRWVARPTAVHIAVHIA
jgi:hypothetical protein